MPACCCCTSRVISLPLNSASPITGLLLVRCVGYSLTDAWIVWSLILYVITGLFWLPVVWMQMRLRTWQARRPASHQNSLRLITGCSGGGLLRVSGLRRGGHDFLADDCATARGWAVLATASARS